METPSSARMAARSQDADPKTTNSAAAQQDDAQCASEKGHRVTLVDITNDSPIVGLAAGSAILKTPGSSAVKAQARRRMPLRTPGSGEALLRCQVKTLLQKVEEETEQQPMITKPSFTAPATADDLMAEVPFKILLGHLRSPSGLVAPNNTPVILGLPGGDNRGLSMCMLEQAFYEATLQKSTDAYATFGSSLAIGGEKKELAAVLEEYQLNRALLFDSPGKSDVVSSPADSSSCGSAVTYQGSAGSTNEKCPSSAWSIQAHARSVHEEEEEELEEERDDDDFPEEADEEDEQESSEDGSEVLMLEGLCQDLSSMTVEVEDDERRVEGGAGLPEFTGKHTRFAYDSDGEVEEAEEEVASSETRVPPSPSVVLLKGIPTPKGKHLRFHEEEEDE